MHKIFRNIILVTLLSLLAACNFNTTVEKAKSGKIDLTQVDFSKDVVLLEGEWEFFPNKIYSPQDLNYSYEPIKPYFVDLPTIKPIIESKDVLDSNYATYRLILNLKEPGIYAIDFDYIYTAANFWVNGKLVYQLGNVSILSDSAKGVYSFGYFPFVIDENDDYTNTEIVVQVSDFESNKKFGITKSLAFAKYDVLMKKNTLAQRVYFAIVGILLVMAFYYFMVFVFYPKNNAILSFSLMTIVIAIRSFYTNTISFGPADFNVSLRISFISAVLFVVLMLHFYHKFLPSIFRKTSHKTTGFIGSLFVLYYLLVPIRNIDILTPFLYLFYATVNIFAFVILIKGVFKKIKGTGLMIVAQFIFILSMINDMMFNSRIIDSGYVSHYTVSLFVLIEAVVIAKSFASAYKENLVLTLKLNGQNKSLEDMVEERTLELNMSNQELRKLSVIAENSHNSIMVFDPDFNLIWVNKSFEELYGLKLDEVKNRKNLRQNAAKSDIEMLLSSLHKGRSVTYDNQIVNAKAERKWLQTTLSPIMIDGELVEIVAIESDITEIKESQDKLLAQSQTVNSSLRYAKTIQSTILPSVNEIEFFFDAFIYYQPRDIVSGDFYFFKEITHSSLTFAFTGIADCTGHGVSGAFMSLIINGLFEDILLRRDVYEPSEVLRILNIEIKKILKQDENQNTDGAALVLMKVVPMVSYYAVTYATANLSFYHYSAQTKQLNSFRGNVNHIGGILIQKVIAFKNYEMKAQPGDIFYLQSDGIIDQPNTKRKRFGKKQYEDLIYSVVNLPMEKQKEIIVESYKNWKGEIPQYDDIAIYAFKLKPISQK
ncbi:MAG: SpoIIE family protein phosphatase [Bacteroidales bacterium]|nr:SpoIIE family protein phosphatase [Bacteroidales bacterium]